jgi:hypothetical protein
MRDSTRRDVLMSSDTYCVYRIVNLKNGLSYIGQTCNLSGRRRYHFYHLSRNTHTNRYLQRAYNKYGEGAFRLEVLERCIQINQINQREIEWIAHFNSYRSGYNLTPGGEGGNKDGTKCTWNGVEYPSVNLAARELGITAVAMWQRIKKGQVCDTDVYSNSIPCVWNGIEYPSKEAAERKLGLAAGVLQNRLNKGYTCDADMPVNGKCCMWNEIEYPTIRAAAKANGVTPSAMHLRLKAGHTCDTDVRRGNYKRISKHAKTNPVSLTAANHQQRIGGGTE